MQVYLSAICVVLALVLFCTYLAYPLYQASVAARPLVARAVPFSRSGAQDTGDDKRNETNYISHMLVLGDSTAVGVGSSVGGSASVPARLAEYLNASVENYAQSGAKTKDLDAQRMQAMRKTYTHTLIQIGANDVVSFGSLTASRDELDRQLTLLKPVSEKIIVLTAGDIGKAPLFRWPLNVLISYRTRVLREYFKAVCARHGALYIDIYAEPDIISEQPARYHASDMFHLSDDGYGYWFEIVKRYLK